jgi:hypothetical protein
VAIATKGDSARKVESPWQRLCFDGLVFRSQAKAPALSFGRGKGGGGREVLRAIFLLELDWSPSSPAGYSHVKGSCFR